MKPHQRKWLIDAAFFDDGDDSPFLVKTLEVIAGADPDSACHQATPVAKAYLATYGNGGRFKFQTVRPAPPSGGCKTGHLAGV